MAIKLTAKAITIALDMVFKNTGMCIDMSVVNFNTNRGFYPSFYNHIMIVLKNKYQAITYINFNLNDRIVFSANINCLKYSVLRHQENLKKKIIHFI